MADLPCQGCRDRDARSRDARFRDARFRDARFRDAPSQDAGRARRCHCGGSGRGRGSDPVGSGFVENPTRPGGNLTGFMFQDASVVGKLLELLTEIAPNVKRAALMFNPDTAPYMESYYVPAFEAAARTLKVTPISAPVHNDAEIEAVIYQPVEVIEGVILRRDSRMSNVL